MVISPFKRKPDENESKYELETESEEEREQESEPEDEMANIVDKTMEEYNLRMQNDNGPNLLPPEISTTSNFEIKWAHPLHACRHPIFGKDHEDAYKHIDEVLDIENYVSSPNVTKDAVMLRLLPVNIKDSTKD